MNEALLAAFGIPPAMVGTGPEPTYRSPYRDWVNWRHPYGCPWSCSCELYAMWAAMDESPDARREAFTQSLLANTGLSRWFDVR